MEKIQEDKLRIVESTKKRLEKIERILSRFNNGEIISDKKIEEVETFLNDMITGEFTQEAESVPESLSEMSEALSELFKMRAAMIAILSGNFDRDEYIKNKLILLGLDTEKINKFRRRIKIANLRRDLKRLERMYNRYNPNYYGFRFLIERVKEEMAKYDISIEDLKRTEKTYSPEFIDFFSGIEYVTFRRNTQQ